MKHKSLVTGLIYQNTEQSSYQELLTSYSKSPLSKADLNMDEAYFDKLVSEFV
jgi:2-oxoglutarate/2-oxoacid ferredoxin oxidoreductase subunit beta